LLAQKSLIFRNTTLQCNIGTVERWKRRLSMGK